MSRKDFAGDIEVVATNVATDMGTIMKLVRDEQSRQGSPSEPSDVPASKAQEARVETSTNARVKGRGKLEKGRRAPPVVAPAAPLLREKVTLQLSLETNERLTEAALRQKLKKEPPDTRQDIVEVALREWLHRQGYDK